MLKHPEYHIIDRLINNLMAKHDALSCTFWNNAMCPSPTLTYPVSPCSYDQHYPVGATTPPFVSRTHDSSRLRMSNTRVLNQGDYEQLLRGFNKLIAFYAHTDQLKALHALHATAGSDQPKVALLVQTHCHLMLHAMVKNLERLNEHQKVLQQALLATKHQQLQALTRQAKACVENQWLSLMTHQSNEAKPSWFARVMDRLRRFVGLRSRESYEANEALQKQYHDLAEQPSVVNIVPPVIAVPAKLSWWMRCKALFRKTKPIETAPFMCPAPAISPSKAAPESPVLSESISKALEALMLKKNALVTQREVTRQSLAQLQKKLMALQTKNTQMGTLRRWWRACTSMVLEKRLIRSIESLEQLRNRQNNQYCKLEQECLVKTCVSEFNAVLLEAPEPQRYAYFAAKCLAVLTCANDSRHGLPSRVPPAWLGDASESSLVQKIQRVLDQEQQVSAPQPELENVVARNYVEIVGGAASWQERQQAEQHFCDAYLASYQKASVNNDDSATLAALSYAQLALTRIVAPYQQLLAAVSTPWPTGRQDFHWQLLMHAKLLFLNAPKQDRSQEGCYFSSVHDLYQIMYGAGQAAKILSDLSVELKAELAACAQVSVANQQLVQLNSQWNQLSRNEAMFINDPVSAFQAIVLLESKPIEKLLQRYLQLSLDAYQHATRADAKKQAALIALFRHYYLARALSEQQIVSLQAMKAAHPDLAALPHHALKAEVAVFNSKEISIVAQVEQKMANVWEAELDRGEGVLSTLPLAALMVAVQQLSTVIGLSNLTSVTSVSERSLPVLEQKLKLERVLVFRIRLLQTQQLTCQYLNEVLSSSVICYPAEEKNLYLATFITFIKNYGDSVSRSNLSKLQEGHWPSLTEGRSGTIHEHHAYSVLIKGIAQLIKALTSYQANKNQARSLAIQTLLTRCGQVTSMIERLAQDTVNDQVTVMAKKLIAFDRLIALLKTEMASISAEYTFFEPSSSELFKVLSTQALLLTLAKDNYQLQSEAKKTTQQCLVRLVSTLKTCCGAEAAVIDAKAAAIFFSVAQFEQIFNPDAAGLLMHYPRFGSRSTLCHLKAA